MGRLINMGRYVSLGLLVLLTLPLFVQGVFDHPLWINDEGHVAEIGREMFLSGDVIVPRLGGQPFVEKPPLYFVVMGICYRWFGITPGAARLPSAIFGFLTVLVVYGIAAAQGRPQQGLLAAFLLASVFMMFRFAHWCVVDSAVCFFTTLGFYFFFTRIPNHTQKIVVVSGLLCGLCARLHVQGIGWACDGRHHGHSAPCLGRQPG